MHADAELTLILVLCLVLATLALPARLLLVVFWSSSSSPTARSAHSSPLTVASSAEASPSKKRKPTSNAQGSSSSPTPPAPLPSSSSSSSTSSTLPFRVLPVNPLENSFARAREIADTKRRRSAPKDPHSHLHSHSSHGSSHQSDMSIDSHPNYFSAAAGLGASSARPALGRPGSRTSDAGLSGPSASGPKSSAPPVRRTGVQGKQPVKKLVIKNFTVTPQLPANYEEETWKVLQQAVRAIQNSKPVASSLEELYKTCENLCHQKYGDSLYKKLSAECERHVNDVLQTLLENNGAQDDFLEAVHTAWTKHCRQLIMIRSIFLYLDRTYVIQTLGVSSIWELGLELWRRLIMQQDVIRTKVLDGVLQLIDRDRSGEAISYPLVTSLLRMLSDIHMYSSAFETPFILHSRTFYHVEAEQCVHSLTVPEYLRHAQRRLSEETGRFEGYLEKSTRRSLVATVEGELLERWSDYILQNGFEGVMADHNLPDLKLWYDLLGRIGHLEKLSANFALYVKKTGKGLVSDPSRDESLVEELLRFKLRMDEVVSKCFQNSELFLNVLKECFEIFVNTRQNKPAELVAKYLDARLRSGNKEQSVDELETTLDRVLILFRYIQGKDVFEAFYKRDLAKRLLLGKSASFDAEKSMLSKLKVECGSGFTTKLEGMFKDMDISRDVMANFRASKMYSKIGHLDLSVNVLTQGHWPTYAPVEANLPPHISQCQEVFKDFYLSKHKGRRLMWQHSLGHCVVKAVFKAGSKELQLSLFQAIVLLLFNDSGDSSLPYKEIRQLTNIESKELNRTLQSLACGKHRVLSKHPKSKDVSETDEFTFNNDFTAPLTRIKINAIQLKETAEENASTNERIFQDRQFQVDAAIVRIMKTRKAISHNQLFSELFDQLKFAIKATDLKKRIESLIDRDYMERDKDDQTLYRYMA